MSRYTPTFTFHSTVVEAPRPSAWGRRCVVLAWLMALAAAWTALAPWHALWLPGPPTLRWGLELIVHGQWLWLVLGGTAAVLAVVARRHSAWLALAVVLGSWWAQLPAAPQAVLQPGAMGAAPAPVLRVASVNLWLDNPDLQALEQWLLSAQAPDLVVLQEFTPAHQRWLQREGAGAALLKRFAHQSLHAQSDPFGMAVLSRWPLARVQWQVPAHHQETPQWHGLLLWQGQVVALGAVHPMPPIDAAYAQVRDARVLQAARQVAGQRHAGVLLGDFNDTPWSAGMRALAPYMQRASGLAPTWPNVWGWGSLLPLDHILVTDHWQVLERGWGPAVGGDHRPVQVSLVLAEQR